MSRIKQIEKARLHLTKALNALSNQSTGLSHVKSTIKSAIGKLDEAANKKKKQITEQQSWWSEIEAGVANQATAPMSQEAYSKSLDQINQMIGKEEDKLKELVDKQSDTGDLLNG